MNIFNKLLKINPTYENVKDKNNILHLIHVTTHSNFIKLKFGKYRLMENKEHFYKAQRLITILSRFVQKIKRQRFVSRKTEIDCDLRMAPFEPKTAIDLIEQRCIYTFNVYDLINIISTALFQQSFMFSNAQIPKNPYTNLNFSVHNLYNIYIKCLSQHISIPEVFQRFFKSDFDINSFRETNKIFLLDNAIDCYFAADAAVTDEIFGYIRDMCYPFCINIDEEFPRSKLYTVFRPYLKCYLRSKLFENDSDIRYYLRCFDLYNPYFGRKFIDDETSLPGFDDRHLPFQEIKNGVFKSIRNSHIFERCCLHKYNVDNFQCVSLRPMSDVTYVDIYIEDHHSESSSEEEVNESVPSSEEEDYDF